MLEDVHFNARDLELELISLPRLDNLVSSRHSSTTLQFDLLTVLIVST